MRQRPPAEALAALRAGLAGALVALDFDGTLAPVVVDPAQARPLAGVADVLAALAPRVGRLAIVTGRPALFVVEVGGLGAVPGLVVLGQYGTERWQAGTLTVRTPAPGVAQARAALVDLPPGARLEDKGTALAVHTRSSTDPAGLLSALGPRLEQLAATTGLECHPGRFVLELRPPGEDKGRALRSLLAPLPSERLPTAVLPLERQPSGVLPTVAPTSRVLPSAVLYAGDDLGDLPAFAELDALAVPVLRVCSGSAETPPALRERADLVVDGPPGVLALLRSLLG